MKYAFVLVLAFQLFACLHKKVNRVYIPISAYLPGKYAAFENAQFCSTFDTLIITHDTKYDNNYIIKERVTFQRKWYDLHYKPESWGNQWESVFDAQSQTLNAINGYPNIEYLPGQSALHLSGILYMKIYR